VDDFGLGLLLKTRQIRRMISSYVGENKEFERQYLSGELEVELTPQGTLAERIRAGGAGIPGMKFPSFATRRAERFGLGAVTIGHAHLNFAWVQPFSPARDMAPIFKTGAYRSSLDRRNQTDRQEPRSSGPKCARSGSLVGTRISWKTQFGATLRLSRRGKQMKQGILSLGRPAQSHVSDDPGNVIILPPVTLNMVSRGSARNFNPVMAKAAKVTIAEVEEIVPTGSLAPGDIHLPGIFVNRLVVGDHFEKRIERLTLGDGKGGLLKVQKGVSKNGQPEAAQDGVDEAEQKRTRIVRRAAREFQVGLVCLERRRGPFTGSGDGQFVFIYVLYIYIISFSPSSLLLFLFFFFCRTECTSILALACQ
jgi:hypothetical protein